MTERQVIEILLSTERDICNLVHNSITEVLRLGYGERGKRIVMDAIEIMQNRLGEAEHRIK